jgi:hypothetical protein
VRVLWLILPLLVGAARAADEQISRIRAQVAERTARTPNYTCLETIERRWFADEYPGSQVLDRMRFEVAVIDGQEQFSWPGGSRFDSQELQETLGRGVTKTGDFSGFLSHIFALDAPAYTRVGELTAAIRPAVRYDYRVPASSGYSLTRNGAQAVVGYHGSFWVDPATLELVRVEIESDGIPPALHTSSTTLAIDYGLVAVGAGSFLLPLATDVRMVSDRGLQSRTITQFSQCRQFLAESSISFEDRPLQQASKTSDAAAGLPPGMILEVALTASIDRKTAAAGDVVKAEVRKEVRAKGGIVIPKGAVLEGRILRLETRGDAGQQRDLLAIRFTKVSAGSGQATLRASVTRCGTGYRAAPGSPRGAADLLRHIDPRGPMSFWGGFVELPKGLALTLATEAVPPR